MNAIKFKILSQIFEFSHRSKDEHLFYCPFESHHNPKFSINIKKNKYKCWVCNRSSPNIAPLIKKFGNQQQFDEWQSVDFENCIEIYDSIFDEQQTFNKPIELPKEYETLCDFENHKMKRPLNYLLNERKFSKQDILRFKMGFCFSEKYKDRIIVPSFDKNGNLNYFVARAIFPTKFPYMIPEEPKKNEVLFNELLIDWNDKVSLVEGVFDSVNAYNSIPLLGKTLNRDSEIVRQIVKHQKEVYIALDNKENPIKIVQLFHGLGLNCYVMNCSPYKDPGMMTKEIWSQKQKEAKYITSENLFDYIYGDL